MAVDAGDYREIGVMSRDFLDRMGVSKNAKQAATKPTIVINIGQGLTASHFDIPEVETSYEEADYEIVEDK